MPICETCLLCGLDLMFIPGFKPGEGEYFHVFTVEKAGQYKFLHRPVPALQLDLFDDRYVPAQGWSGENRAVSAK